MDIPNIEKNINVLLAFIFFNFSGTFLNLLLFF